MTDSVKHRLCRASRYPACKSCGVAWTDHEGAEKLCRHRSMLLRAIRRSPYEVALCDVCGDMTVSLPDGMSAICLDCAQKMEAEQ